MGLSERLKEIRKSKGYTLLYIAKQMGVSEATVQRWESGNIKNLKHEKIIRLADVLGVSPVYLMGWEEADTKEGTDIGLVAIDIMKNEKIDIDSALKKAEEMIDSFQAYNNIPGAIPIDSDIISFKIVGKVAAGYNCAAVEEYTGDSVEIPLSMLRGYDPSQCFALLVKGNSMYPKMLDGDIALVYKCESVDSGTTAVILYNGDEATIKKVKYVYGEDWLELIPANPEYETKRIEGTDLEQCHVLGKVIKLIRDI